jgi:hypothetical protein
MAPHLSPAGGVGDFIQLIGLKSELCVSPQGSKSLVYLFVGTTLWYWKGSLGWRVGGSSTGDFPFLPSLGLPCFLQKASNSVCGFLALLVIFEDWRLLCSRKRKKKRKKERKRKPTSSGVDLLKFDKMLYIILMN